MSIFDGKTPLLAIDQYGDAHGYHRTLKSLRQRLPGRVSNMYVDKVDRSVVQTGYVIGTLWLTLYKPVEVPAC